MIFLRCPECNKRFGHKKCCALGETHSYVISGMPSAGVWGYCERCGMRTPEYPWFNGAWAKDLFKRAKAEGTLSRDESLRREDCKPSQRHCQDVRM